MVYRLSFITSVFCLLAYSSSLVLFCLCQPPRPLFNKNDGDINNSNSSSSSSSNSSNNSRVLEEEPYTDPISLIYKNYNQKQGLDHWMVSSELRIN